MIYDSGLATKNGDNYIPDANHKFGSKVEYVQINGVDHVKLKLDAPIDAGVVTTQDAETAYDKILDNVGASLYRDAVDLRYMEEARTGTVTYHGKVAYVDKNGKTYATSNTEGILDFINDPDENENSATASFPELKSISRSSTFDTDGDGIPDEWEKANGLNPNVNDAALYTVDPRGWYTNIEVYANSLVEHIMKAGNENAIDTVDEYYPEVKQTSINVVEMRGEVERIEYYDLNGIRLTDPVNGINIRRTIFTDGSSVTDKVIK